MFLAIMTRLAVCCGLIGALAIAMTGCSPDTSQPGPEPGVEETTIASAESRGPLGDWPEPDAILLLTGQMNGYLEPCGCTQGQRGGLGRRLSLVRELRDGPDGERPVAVLDLGSLIKDPVGERGGYDQTQIKFGIALQAFREIGYDAVAISADDLTLGVAETLGQLGNLVGEDVPAFVSANVETTEGLGFDQATVPSQQISLGSRQIGVTAVTDPSQIEALSDPDTEVFLTLRDPIAALGEVLGALVTKTDLQIVLVQGDEAMAERVAKTYPEVDLIVTRSEYDTPSSDPTWLNDGRTMLVQVGTKGMYAGLVGLFNEETDDPLRFRRVGLGLQFDNEEPIKSLIEVDYQDELEAMGVVENYPAVRALSGGRYEAFYVGAENCKSCHPSTFAKWDSSRHAKAARPVFAKGRQFDAECITCHTTGFGRETGYRSKERTSHLLNQQCENCHGPGSLHVSEPTNPDYLAAIALTEQRANQGGLCIMCHDQDNSPHFDFDTYYAKIRHVGMDRYDRPSVREGIPLEDLRRIVGLDAIDDTNSE